MYRILLVFLLASTTLSAQLICKGILTDSATHQPIEFANIGIIGKGFGTVTNEKGEYSFTIPDSLSNSKVMVSLIGYRSKRMSASDLRRLSSIHLTQESINLGEVAVSSKKIKTKILGNKTDSKNISAGFKNNTLGAEMAIRLHIKHKQTHLKKLMFQINNNTIDNVIFRCNIYSVDKKGYPDQNILKQNLLITAVEKTGLQTFDLTPYNLFLDEDVFISLEWVKDLGDASKLMFATKIIGSATYFKQASQDKWEKVTPIGIGLYVEAAY